MARGNSLTSRSVMSSPWMNYTATWYSPAGGVGNGLTTRSGLRVSEEIIAVDKSIIPIGSLIEVQYNDGRVERKLAADTGGAIKGNRIDIFTWSEDSAKQNGRQQVKIRIVGHRDI